MESLSIDSLSVGTLAMIVAGVVFFACTLLVMQAWAMRCSVRTCGGDSIGLPYSALVVVASGISGAIGTGAVAFAVARPNPLLTTGVGVAVAVGALCLMLRMGPIRALGVYLLSSILGSVVALIFTILCAVVLFFVVPRPTIDALAQQVEEAANRAAVNDGGLNGGAAAEEHDSAVGAESITAISTAGGLATRGSANGVEPDQLGRNLQSILDQTLFAAEQESVFGTDASADSDQSAEARRQEYEDAGYQVNPFVK